MNDDYWDYAIFIINFFVTGVLLSALLEPNSTVPDDSTRHIAWTVIIVCASNLFLLIIKILTHHLLLGWR